MNSKLLNIEILQPYSILKVTISNSLKTTAALVESVVVYEIPPCSYDGEMWKDTSADDYEPLALKAAIADHISIWTEDIKEAYKVEFLKTYVHRIRQDPDYVSKLNYYEIESVLDNLIKNDIK
jgi:hypothetical protein